MPNMTVNSSGSHFGTAIVTVDGEIDLATAPTLSRELQKVEEADLVLELSRVSFLSLAGVHVLLAVHRRLGAAGRALVLAASSRPVYRTIAASRVDGVLPMAASLEQAFAMLAASRPRFG